jgi:hypothetical protein
MHPDRQTGTAGFGKFLKKEKPLLKQGPLPKLTAYEKI